MAELLYSPEPAFMTPEEADVLYDSTATVMGRIATGNFQSWSQPQIDIEYMSTAPDGFVMPDGKGLGAMNAPWAYAAIPARLLLEQACFAEEGAYQYVEPILEGTSRIYLAWNDESYVGPTDGPHNPDLPAPRGELNPAQVSVKHYTHLGNTFEMKWSKGQLPVWRRSGALVSQNEFHVAKWVAAVIDEQLPPLR